MRCPVCVEGDHPTKHKGGLGRKQEARLARRIHGGNGEHRTDGKCGCLIWDNQGFKRPGSGRKS